MNFSSSEGKGENAPNYRARVKIRPSDHISLPTNPTLTLITSAARTCPPVYVSEEMVKKY